MKPLLHYLTNCLLKKKEKQKQNGHEIFWNEHENYYLDWREIWVIILVIILIIILVKACHLDLTHIDLELVVPSAECYFPAGYI